MKAVYFEEGNLSSFGIELAKKQKTKALPIVKIAHLSNNAGEFPKPATDNVPMTTDSEAPTTKQNSLAPASIIWY